MKHPYFGMLASRLKQEPKEGLRGYASNGKRFLYDPEFMGRRSVDEVMFILTNCVMHHVLNYRNAVKAFDAAVAYELPESVKLALEASYAKFDETVDVAIKLGRNNFV